MEKLKLADLERALSGSNFAILDFGSPGCAPCKKVPALVEEVIAELKGLDIRAWEVDIVEELQLAQKFFVMCVPTILIFKQGNEVARFNSLPKKDKLIRAFQ